MGNLHVISTLETSMLIQLYNATTSTYDYLIKITHPRMADYFIEYRSTGSFTGATFSRVDIFQPNTLYLLTLYRTAKGGNNWGSAIHSASALTQSIVEPSASQYLPTYLPNIQNQSIYENGVYRGEANSCVANTLSVFMDILAYRNRASNPQNNYFSPSYIYGNRTRQAELSSGEAGMHLDKTIEQLNVDGVPVWSHIPENDNGYKTFPDNRFLQNNHNAGYGIAGQGAKNLFDNRSDTLNKQAKVNRMNFPLNYSFNFSGFGQAGDPRSFTSTRNYCSFYNCQQIADWVQSNGVVAISFYIANNFSTVPSSGILANPNPDSYFNGVHSAVILGWITLSGKKYWICQNSWDTYWGDDGYFYMPMDYAATSNMVFYGGVNWNWIFRTHSSTYVQPALPSIPSAPIANNIYNGQPRISGGVALTWTAGNDNNTFDLRYRIGTGAYTQLSSLNRSTRLVTSLSFGTSYGWSVRGKNYRGDSNWSGENILTTAPQTPTITTSSLDAPNNRVSITVGSLSGNFSFIRMWYRNITDGGVWAYQQETTIGSHWVTGLTSDKEYEFKVSSFYTVSSVDIESRDGSGNIGYSNIVSYTIGGRPDNWAWSYNISSGQNVYSVVNKSINIMLGTEWNNFTTRINLFRAYKGLSDYSFTSIPSNTNVTKEIINEALNAIRAMSAHFTGGNTLIPNRVAGQNILDSNIYINMRDCLNSIT